MFWLEKCKLIILVVILLFVFAGILTFVTPFILLANEGRVLKADLDNPYIDANYEGWQSVEISNWGSCLFPREWKVSEEKAIVHITDTDGHTVAWGTVFDADHAAFASEEAFLSEILGYEVTSSRYEYTGDFVSIDNSKLGAITTMGDYDNTYGFLRLQMDRESPALFMIFPTYTAMNTSDILDVVQAIAFSYSFPKECKQCDN